MRELKFRAWDIKNKRFCFFGFHPQAIHWSHPQWLENSILNPAQGVTFPDIQNSWQQYTGLTDKNGKEIYEGDVVKPNWETQSGGARVFFENSAFGIYWINSKHPDDQGFKCLWDAQENAWNWELEQFEVIGNIYENPELLKDPEHA